MAASEFVVASCFRNESWNIDRILNLLINKSIKGRSDRINLYKNMFKQFEGKTLPSEQDYVAFAMPVAERLLESDFTLDAVQIDRAIHESTKYVARKSADKYRRLHANATHFLLQIATLMAWYLDKKEYIKVLTDKSKEIDFCYRLAYISSDSSPDISYLKVNSRDEMLLIHLKDPVFKVPADFHVTRNVKTVKMQKQMNTICQIRQLLFDNKAVDLALKILDEFLDKRWPDLAPLPPIGEHQQIKLFEAGFPGLEIFLWWKCLEQNERKMHGALHDVLCEMEQSENTDVSEDDGVTRLWGFVPDEIFNSSIKNGGRIAESSLSLPGVLHGVHVHRIQLAVIHILIQNGTIKLPSDETLTSILNAIVDRQVFGSVFDSNYTWFGSPYYFMSYLRNADHLPRLRQYAVFSFFNAMDKIMRLHNIPDSDYESVIYPQLCHEYYFSHDKPDEATLKAISSRNDLHHLTEGKNYFFYSKRKPITVVGNDSNMDKCDSYCL